VLFETGRWYHDTQKRYLKILLLIPDHLHMLVGIPGDANLSNLVRDFKCITAKIARIHWQRNFFDHRLRYENPLRAGLIRAEDEWPYVPFGESSGGSAETPAGD
jgi:putative transposase